MSKKSLRIAYFGTPDFATKPLEVLLENNFDVCVVVSQPDRRKGRGKKISEPEVKSIARKYELPILQPERINAEFIQQLAEYDADYFVVCAYGKILPEKLINLPKYTLNIHASLLPKYRGASPIHAAILHGEKQTGVSIMKIVKELDAGDVMLQKSILIDDADTTESLSAKLSDVGASALIEALQIIENKEEIWIEQDHKNASYAHKITPESAYIHWDQSATAIDRHIRAYCPEPGAFTFINDEKIKILEAHKSELEINQKPGYIQTGKKTLHIQTKDKAIEIIKIQRAGKNAQTVVDFLNGYRKELQWCT
ncbi:MAG: methionyl-tRNA formyltransferase [Bdellovibrionales bacterium]|nr:methionyl-tRNA formyltransferase [Bdellovibrionales bacterium]